MYKKKVYLLGSGDAEREYIRRLLQEAKCIYHYTTIDGFVMVTSSKAYRAAETANRDQVWIECAPANGGKTSIRKEGADLIDHHHPNDPGYGKSPDQFLEASSIGQLIAYLISNGWEPSWEKVRTGWQSGYVFDGKDWWYTYNRTSYKISKSHKYVAAADHCLLAAYQGRCPGVSIKALMEWRETKRSTYQKISVREIRERIKRAQNEILKASKVKMGNYEVADLRGKDVPELPEAAARLGLPVVASVRLPQSEDLKIVLQAASADLARYFQNIWSVDNGLTKTYGDPNRGMVGAFLFRRK